MHLENHPYDKSGFFPVGFWSCVNSSVWRQYVNDNLPSRCVCCLYKGLVDGNGLYRVTKENAQSFVDELCYKRDERDLFIRDTIQVVDVQRLKLKGFSGLIFEGDAKELFWGVKGIDHEDSFVRDWVNGSLVAWDIKVVRNGVLMRVPEHAPVCDFRKLLVTLGLRDSHWNIHQTKRQGQAHVKWVWDEMLKAPSDKDRLELIKYVESPEFGCELYHNACNLVTMERFGFTDPDGCVVKLFTREGIDNIESVWNAMMKASSDNERLALTKNISSIALGFKLYENACKAMGNSSP